MRAEMPRLRQFTTDAMEEWDYREIERQRQLKRQAEEAERLLTQLSSDGYQTLYHQVKTDITTRYPQVASYMPHVFDETIKAHMVNELKQRANPEGWGSSDLPPKQPTFEPHVL